MINVKRLQRKFNLTIKQLDIEVFQKMRTGYCSSELITYSYGPSENDTDEIIVEEIYSTTQMINETISYNQVAKENELQTLPEKCFIIGCDMGGDPIVYNAVTGQISFFTALSWYEEVIVLDSIHTFSSLLKDVEEYVEPVFPPTTKFSIPDVQYILKSLNIVENDVLVNFLLELEVGENYSEPYQYESKEQSGVIYTGRFGMVYDVETMIEKTKKFRNNELYERHDIRTKAKYLVFGEDVGGFSDGLDLDTYSIHLITNAVYCDCLFGDIESFFKFVKNQ